jgi:hypothetical protein
VTFTETKLQFLRWAKKRDEFLTILGALIIFAAFLARDMYGDKAREVHDSLTTGAANFLLESNLVSVSGILRETRWSVEEVQQDLEHTKVSLKQGRDQIKDQTRALLILFRGHIGNLAILRMNIPRDQDRGCSQEHIDSLVNLVEKADKLNDEDDDPESAQALLAGKFEQEVSPCEKQVLDAASRAYDVAREKKETAENLSYLCFGAGWMLTLVGKLAKIEVEGTAD